MRHYDYVFQISFYNLLIMVLYFSDKKKMLPNLATPNVCPTHLLNIQITCLLNIQITYFIIIKLRTFSSLSGAFRKLIMNKHALKINVRYIFRKYVCAGWAVDCLLIGQLQVPSIYLYGVE